MRETGSAGFRQVFYHACTCVSLTASDVFVTCDTTPRTGLVYMRGDYRQNQVWNFIMFPDAVFNNFAGVFDVLNDVRQNVAVVLLFLYSIIPNLDAIIRVRMLLCETSMLLFVSVCSYAKPRCYYS